MKFKKIAMFSVMCFLFFGIFGCELPGQNKGDTGPTGGTNTGIPNTGGTGYTGGGGGYTGGGYTGGGGYTAGNTPPTVFVKYDVNTVQPGGKIRLFAEATDPNGDYINYHWFTPSAQGYFTEPGPDAQSCTWVAPATSTGMPSVEIMCEVNDGKGGFNKASVFVYINYGAGGNNYVNAIPVVDSINGSPNNVPSGGRVRLSIAAHDNDDPILTYNWHTNNGMGYFENPGPNSQSCDWVAPPSPGSYELICDVKDPKGGFSQGRIWIFVQGAAMTNRPPTITSITANPTMIMPNGVANLMVTASDPDGDPLTFRWGQWSPEVPELGMFTPPSPNMPSPTWQAPIVKASNVGGRGSVLFNISCEVSDGKGGMFYQQIPVTVYTQP